MAYSAELGDNGVSVGGTYSVTADCLTVPPRAKLAFVEHLIMTVASENRKMEIQHAVRKICARFTDEYWLAKDLSGEFPEEFYKAMAENGWLGIAMPEEYGGSALGITEAAAMMREVAESGAAIAGCSAVHINIFGLQPVVVFGSSAQKERFLPPLIRGEEKACFAVTEPDAGLNTSEITTWAERVTGGYLVAGQKIWISTAGVASKILILARTRPLDRSARRTDGLSLFYTTLDRSSIEVRPIRKMGRHSVDSNVLFIDQLFVPDQDLIGAEGNGFKQLLHGLNPERILIAAEAVGLGFAALNKASEYARQRQVFGRVIGQNQGIQHPLARAWMNLEAADLMVQKAALLYDNGRECGTESNAAKFLAAEAAFAACDAAVMTLGGMGYASEFHVERYFRESLIPRIAPISSHMIMNFVAEKVLGLPRSY